MENASVVVVEDNTFDLEMIMDALSELKMQQHTCIARDGVEATKYFFDSGDISNSTNLALPRLVLLDLKLPKVNGLEVLKILKTDKKTKHIPVVIFTSSNEEVDRKESYKYDANSYIVKPLDADEFAACVKNIAQYWVMMNATI